MGALDDPNWLDPVHVNIVLKFASENARIIQPRLGADVVLSYGGTCLGYFTLERAIGPSLAFPASALRDCHFQNDVVRQGVVGHDGPPIGTLGVEIEGDGESIKFEDLDGAGQPPQSG